MDFNNTYLFTWNPSKWHWAGLGEAIYLVNNKKEYITQWSCGSRVNLHIGEDVFLMKLGNDSRGINKGIVGYGVIVSDPYESRHWDDSLAIHGAAAIRVDIDFKVLSDEPIFDLDSLQSSYPDFKWTPQAGGVRIPEVIADGLRDALIGFIPVPNDPDGQVIINEGSIRYFTSKSYDRSTLARQLCIEAHGYACSICGFDFEGKYGDIGRQYIEVHHLKPLHEANESHQINPVNDLRPVCANCHRMLHKNKSVLAIEELKMMLRF